MLECWCWHQQPATVAMFNRVKPCFCYLEETHLMFRFFVGLRFRRVLDWSAQHGSSTMSPAIAQPCAGTTGCSDRLQKMKRPQEYFGC